MPDSPNLPSWDQGKIINADDLNKLSKAIQAINRSIGDNWLERYGDTNYGRFYDYFQAIVQADGGDAELTYTDNLRCYVKRAKPKSTLATTDVFDGEVDNFPNDAPFLTATNLACLPLGGAMPPADTQIIVFHFWTRAIPASPSKGIAGKNSTDFYVFWWTRQDGLFPVNVSQNGGANGTNSTASTYTYDVEDRDGNSLGTAMTPEQARILNGAVTAAETGTGFYDTDGSFVLYDVREVFNTGACS